jgi:hypothetical protein
MTTVEMRQAAEIVRLRLRVRELIEAKDTADAQRDRALTLAGCYAEMAGVDIGEPELRRHVEAVAQQVEYLAAANHKLDRFRDTIVRQLWINCLLRGGRQDIGLTAVQTRAMSELIKHANAKLRHTPAPLLPAPPPRAPRIIDVQLPLDLGAYGHDDA